MIGTTLKLLTRQPELLLNYVFAYSTLARDEIALAKMRLVRRVVAGAIAFATLLAFLVLAGIALIIVSASSQPYATWALLCVPGFMLVLCAFSTAIALARGEPSSRDSLGSQLHRDIQSFRVALESRR
jgi:uncharacterized RDD family membrane protein YckC